MFHSIHDNLYPYILLGGEIIGSLKAQRVPFGRMEMHLKVLK